MKKMPAHTLRKKLAALYWDTDISPADLEKLLHGEVDRIGHIDRVHLYRRLLMSYDWYTLLSMIPPERLKEMLSESVLQGLQPASSLRERYRYARTLLFG